MKVATFTSVATRYAQVFGRNDRVRLTFGGKDAFTDCKTYINLPALPAGTMMTPYEARVMNGYLDHETGHIRFTDPNVFNLYEKELKEIITHHLWNVIEDVREENCQIQKYPGSEPYLNDLCFYVDKLGQSKDGQIPITKSYRLLELFYKEAYAVYRDIDTAVIQGDLIDEVPIGPKIHALMKQYMPVLRTAGDSAKLAIRIRQLLDDQIKEDQRKAGQSLISAMNAAGINVKDLEEAAAFFDKLRERSKAYQELMARIATKNSPTEDKKDKKQSKVRMRWDGKAILPPKTTSNDRIFVPSEKNRSQYVAEKVALTGEILAVKKMARIYLQSFKAKTWTKGLDEGTLDEDSLHGMSYGDKNLYKQLRERREIDTALLLLLDLSTSMNGDLVRQTAILLAEATAPITQVKLAIAGFTTNNRAGYLVRDFSKPNSGVGRCDGVDILLYKDYKEPYAKAADRLGAIRTINSTPLGDAYGYSFENIVVRPERRKIVWVVSDGDPAIQIEDSTHNEYLLMKKIHRQSKANGVEFWGLGITVGRSLKLREYVDRYAEIKSCAELPQMVLESLKELVK